MNRKQKINELTRIVSKNFPISRSSHMEVQYTIDGDEELDIDALDDPDYHYTDKVQNLIEKENVDEDKIIENDEVEIIDANKDFDLVTNFKQFNKVESLDIVSKFERTIEDYILICEFFSGLKKKSLKIKGLEIDCFLYGDSKHIPDNIYASFGKEVKIVLFTYLQQSFILRIDTFYDSSERFNVTFTLSPKNNTKINIDYLYSFINFCIYRFSKYKGNKIKNIGDDRLLIELSSLDDIGMDELFFPEVNKKYIDLFTNTFKIDGNVLRYLLVGNPGTGKTQLGIALANELQKLGVTIIQTKINEVFPHVIKLATILAPSLILIDDIDLSLGDRNGYFNGKMLEIFLNSLDGSNEIPKNVGLICSTNALEMLDVAAQRPERFNKLLEFSSLDKPSIEKIILKALTKNYSQEVIDRNKEYITDYHIIDYLYDEAVTGAYIYNITKMTVDLFEKVLLDKEKTYETYLNSIKEDRDSLKAMRKNSYLSDKVQNSNSNGKMGFGR